MGQLQALQPAPKTVSFRRVEDVCAINHSRRLGQGAFGTVWHAKLVKGGEVVAVKELEKRRMQQQHVPASMVMAEVNFMRECSDSDSFVKLLDFVETKGIYFIILEFCDGGNLEGAAKECEGRLGEPQVAHMVLRLLEGVEFLHSRNICHRDIKPQNIMIVGGSACSETAKVKLGDFGIAARLEPGKLLVDKVGTPAFMAPEMHLLPGRSKGYDAKVDVWAMGVVLVFLFSLEYPFLDGNGRLLRDQLLNGGLPLWSMDSFSGLFQRVQEVAGIRRKRPSRSGQDLVRRLLNPGRRERLSARRALEHSWFKPGTDYDDRGDDLPLLKWSEFEESLTGIDREMRRVAGNVSDAAKGVADTMQNMAVDVEVHRKRTREEVERGARCHYCRMPSSGASHNCPECYASVCYDCAMRELAMDLKCPNCKDRSHNEALAEFLAVGEAYSTLATVSDMLSKAALKAAQDLSSWSKRAWTGVERMGNERQIMSW